MTKILTTNNTSLLSARVQNGDFIKRRERYKWA